MRHAGRASCERTLFLVEWPGSMDVNQVPAGVRKAVALMLEVIYLLRAHLRQRLFAFSSGQN